MVKFKAYLLILLLQILFSCRNEFDERTRQVSLSPFHTVVLNSVFNVYVTQDTTFSIKIIANGQVSDKVSAIVINDTLSISNNAKQQWLHPETNKVTLYITSNQPAQIRVNQTCFIQTINPIISDSFFLLMESPVKLMQANLELNCKTFNYWNNYLCGGRITLTGKVGNLTVNSFSIMSVDASNLIADNANIQNSSAGDCDIFVTDELDYSLHGTGNIYVRGNPKKIIELSKTSSGQLIVL